MECRKTGGWPDTSGFCRARAESSERRQYHCLVRDDMEPGTVPADGSEVMEARAGIRDGGGAAYPDSRDCGREDHEGVIS